MKHEPNLAGESVGKKIVGQDSEITTMFEIVPLELTWRFGLFLL